VAAIKDGSLNRGGGMPPWKDKLSDADIEATLVWVQSLWPPEIYAQWQRIDQSAKAAR
jgi:mono/diheme cytochrome c family protein